MRGAPRRSERRFTVTMKLVAAIAAGTLVVGLLVGAAGAVLTRGGSARDHAPYAQMMGGNGQVGYGMMGSGSGYGMMGGSWSYDDMLNEMGDHMGWATASPGASEGAGQ